MAQTTNRKKQSAQSDTGKKNTQKKKKPTKKELEELRLRQEALAAQRKAQKRQITAIIIFFVAIFLLVLAAVPGGIGSFYNKLHEVHVGIWGFGAYVFPIMTCVFAYFISSDKDQKGAVGTYIWCWILLIICLSMIHVIAFKYFGLLNFGEQIETEFISHTTKGGAVGAIFGGLLFMICKSKPLCVIIYIILISLIAILLSKITLQRFIDTVSKPAKKIGKITGEAVTRRRYADSIGMTDEEYAQAEELMRKKRKRMKQEESDSPAFENEFFTVPKREYTPPKRKKSKVEFKMPSNDDFSEKHDYTAPADESENIDFGSAEQAEQTDFTENMQSAQQDINAADSFYPESDNLDKDGFESMFATIDAMEKASEERADISDFPLADIFELDAAETEAVEKEKVKLSDDEFDQAKSEIEDEIAENTEAVVVPEYKLPPVECLNQPVFTKFSADRNELSANAAKLIDALNSFKVEAKVVDIVPGPSVTRYELQPAPGVKISKFTNLSDDLALHLAAPAGVRIEAPIPNKSAIGIEVPNRDRASVYMRELIESDDYRNAKSKLNVALGKDITGCGVYIDIAKMPHLLVAGTTGSGKSVCLNSMIVSILYNAKPGEVKLLLIDPKSVEFSVYNGIPHLLVPVVSEARKAAGALGWAVTEMINRYKILNDNGVRDIYAYNELCEDKAELEKLPQIVIIIDELSDLMSVAPSEVEDSITRLAQMARAAGMHLVVATQRPSVDVITGLIKANIPSRIALSVSSQIDSRTILDSQGAEKLLGNGDMLVAPVGKRKPVRVQGCYISDEEIKRVVDFVKTQESGQYDENIQDEIDRQAVIEKKKGGDKSGNSVGSLNGDDELLMRAVELVVNNPECCSISAMQRKLGLGFSKAGRLMDTLEAQGIVGPSEGSKGRKVLLSKAEWLQMNALSTDDSDEDEQP